MPIVCASASLCQFWELLGRLFSKPQPMYLVTVLLGLSQYDERQAMTAWLRAVRSGRSMRGMSEFLWPAPWSAVAVGAAQHTLRATIQQELLRMLENAL